MNSVIVEQTLTRLANFMANRKEKWLKDYLIADFISRYQVSLEEAVISDPKAFESFNAFFTRALKPTARPLGDAPLVSPADGKILAFGPITPSLTLQAKGHDFTVEALLGEASPHFKKGSFCTVYLAPQDYHRVHSPLTGMLESMRYIPGRLFSVRPNIIEQIPSVFSQNERIVFQGKSEHGRFAVVMVGAMIVGKLVAYGHGPVNQEKRTQIQEWKYADKPIQKADELGYFCLGSTAIVLTEQEVTFSEDVAPDASVRMGMNLGTFPRKS